jgi:hypothetical protein
MDVRWLKIYASQYGRVDSADLTKEFNAARDNPAMGPSCSPRDLISDGF